MKKVAFLLGSFDPIHIGHLHMATSILNKGLVNEIIFVPEYKNPEKPKSTEFEHRCMMVQLAIEGIENCKMSAIEYTTTSPHYSYNTLKLLKSEYSNDDLYLIVGADLASSIRYWHEGGWILENFNIITVDREGYDIEADISKTLDISSSEIRELVKNNKQIYPLVPKVINQYIKQFNLYK